MSLEKTINQDKIKGLKKSVLSWLETMQTGPVDFAMNAGADSTIFTSCFALFILDLLGEVKTWPQKDRDIWVDHINTFQDNESGYYIPDGIRAASNSKAVQQLTCFCMSALDILDSSPKYKLSFLNQWHSSREIYDYLKNMGCFEGKPTTGNMAMFLAIFLTYEYERYNNRSALENLERWFQWHEKTQNRSTGFWGALLRYRYYEGLQNAFHQFVIFNYWNRAVPSHTKIVDKVLSLQDQDGHFAPVPGGGGCWDFDAADILIHCGYGRGYKVVEITDALTKLYFTTLDCQNEDGGFSESKRRPPSIMKALVARNLRFIFFDHNPYLWYYRLRSLMSISRNKRQEISTHWTKKGRRWEESDLWDTWFRCLTLAEISKTIKIDHFLSDFPWKFHRHIGLGYFREAWEPSQRQASLSMP